VAAPLPAARKIDDEGAGRSSWENGAEPLPVARLRPALDDLFIPSALRYWLDFAGSVLCFWGGFTVAATASHGIALALPAFAVSVLGLYRAVIFIHELAHFPPGRMHAFRAVWNFCCGMPVLAPDFLYGSHADHHRRTAYGTADDGEYLPWGRPGNRLAIVMFVLSGFLAFPAGVVRFGVLAPLSWLSPRLRRWVAVSASSLVVDVGYRRLPPSGAEARRWVLCEAAVFFYLCAALLGLLLGIIPWGCLLLLYLTISAALFLNSLRTLAAHRYRSFGRPLALTGQMLDSVNYPRRAWLNELWAPVGLRFHAVHHLFPGLPYHNLATAHARLLRLLPPDSPYRRTEGRSLMASLRELWRAAGADGAKAATLGREGHAGLAE
jgi:fatty acid desaturase